MLLKSMMCKPLIGLQACSEAGDPFAQGKLSRQAWPLSAPLAAADASKQPERVMQKSLSTAKLPAQVCPF